MSDNEKKREITYQDVGAFVNVPAAPEACVPDAWLLLVSSVAWKNHKKRKNLLWTISR